MIAPFRLQAGDRVPVQQSTTTCGSASLTVARMLVDPSFARWIRLGVDKDAKDDDVPDAQTVEQRFAAHEQVVARRTNALVGAGGRIQFPWPRALGTPPWGAIGELEYGAPCHGRTTTSSGSGSSGAAPSRSPTPPSSGACATAGHAALHRQRLAAPPSRARHAGDARSGGWTSTSRRSGGSSTCRRTGSSSAASGWRAGMCRGAPSGTTPLP